MLSLVSHVGRPLATRHCLRQSFRFFATHNHNNATSLIINAVGYDRLGIVSDVTGIVIRHGGNVGDSQAAKLGQHFSLMMLVSIPTDQQDQFRAQLNDLKDMNATVFEAEHGAPTLTPRPAYQGIFSLEGADNPGIVHIVTTALAKHGLNIDKLETDQEIAPHGGTVLFRMKGKTVAYDPLPSSFNAAQIRQDLQELGASLNCDVELEEVDDDGTSASFYGG